jgi:hypothetical protein
MKKFNLSLVLFVVAVFALLSFSPVIAYADTDTAALYYSGPGGQSSGNDYVFPYNFNIDGSATLTPLMCLSFTLDITPGESWTATIAQVMGNTNYEKAAYIFSQASAPGASTDQIAVAQWSNWVLFDAGASSSVPTNYQGDVSALLDTAAAYVLANPDSSLYSQHVVYEPYSWSSSGEPQFLMGDTPTPEPGSLILLGTGMFGLAAIWFRRKRFAL